MFSVDTEHISYKFLGIIHRYKHNFLLTTYITNEDCLLVQWSLVCLRFF